MSGFTPRERAQIALGPPRARCLIAGTLKTAPPPHITHPPKKAKLSPLGEFLQVQYLFIEPGSAYVRGTRGGWEGIVEINAQRPPAAARSAGEMDTPIAIGGKDSRPEKIHITSGQGYFRPEDRGMGRCLQGAAPEE